MSSSESSYSYSGSDSSDDFSESQTAMQSTSTSQTSSSSVPSSDDVSRSSSRNEVPTNAWTRVTSQLSSKLDQLLGRVAYKASVHAWKVIIAALVFTLVCAVALFLNIQIMQSDGEKLWVPRNNESAKNKFQNEIAFPEATGRRFDTLILSGKDETNVLTKAHLDQVWNLHETVIANTIEHDGKTWTYQDLCSKRTVNGVSDCALASVLQFWQMDKATYLADADPVGTVRGLKGTIVGRGGSFIFTPELVGGRDVETGVFNTAGAYRMVYYMQGAELGAIEAWEQKVIDSLGQLNDDHPLFDVRMFMDISPDKELENSTGGDILLFIGSVVLISIFCSIILVRVSKTLYGHWILAQVSLLQTFMAIGISFGLATYFQIPFVSFISTLLFLMVGIGVDNSIILIQEFDRLDYSLPVEERVSETYSRVGASVTLTNLTSFVAFAVGASSIFPAITYFCLYAALSLLALYTLTMTFFAACITIDARRIQKGRMDILPCFTSTEQRDNPPATKSTSLLSTGLRKYYAPLLLKRPVQAAVVLVFVGWFAFSIYGATQVRQGLDQRDLFRKDSYLVSFLNDNDKYFVLPTPVSVMVRPRAENPALNTLDGQKNMEELATLATSLTTDVVGLQYWYIDYLTYIGAAHAADGLIEGKYAPEASFTTWLNEFLAQPQFLGYSADLVRDASGQVTTYKFVVRTRGLDQANRSKGANIMEHLRDTLRQSPMEIYDTYPEYVFFETDLVIVSQTIFNLGMVLLAVAFVCSVLLVSPVATGSVFVAIIMIDVDVFGLMYLWDIPLDAVAMVNLIMAVGFSVDFSAHTAHSFMMRAGTLSSRIIGSVSEMGTSVLYGGISTFLGMLLLAFAQSSIFNTFFKMFLGIVVFGLLHGLIFIPVLLAILAPHPSSLASHGDHEDSVDSIRELKARKTSTTVSPIETV